MANLDPSFALQQAIFTALMASTDLAAVFAAAETPSGAPRVYSRVPEGAQLPYITIGEDDVHDDSAGEIDSSEVYANVHCWSGSPSLVEIKGMANAVREALKPTPDLTASGHVCVVNQYQSTKLVGVPDGETEHRVVVFKFLTDPISD